MLLLDSDIVFDPQIVARLLASEHQDILALNNHPLGEEEMKVVPDGEGRVKEISKTCRIEDAAGESVGFLHEGSLQGTPSHDGGGGTGECLLRKSV